MFGLMSKEAMLKMVFSMAKGYFDKKPSAEIRISEKMANEYLVKNLPELKVTTEITKDGVDIIIKKS